MVADLAAPAALPPSDPLVEEVRALLDHLYDYAYLHNHPLTWRLYGEGANEGVARAQRMRATLLDAIERLRPQPRLSNDEMRTYAILTYRCVDSLTMNEIAAKLALSRRQAYREYAAGVAAVASLLRELLPTQPAAVSQTPAAATRLGAANQEVARLATALQLEAFELAALVHNVAELLAPRVQHTGAAFCIQMAASSRPAVLPEEMPLAGRQVVADRALLRQALLNFFSYALDQAGRGGQVTVTLGEEGRQAALQLAAWPGSSEEAAARREGIGIIVAQKLVEAMGGQAALSETDGAWRCSLLLPAAQRATVLVVDDNADLTALLQRYAAGRNLCVVGAAGGVQALELAQTLRPQLIILDLMLPHMDGWEILQRLRQSESTQTTPVVICSVLNEPGLALSLGASDYVTKPISQAALVAVLQRWLGTLPPAV